MSPMALALAGLVLGTFVSEDLTLLTAAVAVVEGQLPAWPAMAACAAGLFIGDVGLWWAGRLGRGPLARWRDAAAVSRLVDWVDRAPATAIFASRCLPGARVPMYVAAGAWSRRPTAVVLAMLAAALVWTPVCIGVVMLTGAVIEASPAGSSVSTWTFRIVALLAAVLLLRASHRRRRDDGRSVDRRWRRLTQWEFWPAWIVNAPIVAWVVMLGIRHRSLTLFTAANPGMPEGGFVGESKAAILASVPPAWVLPWLLLPSGPLDGRMAQARAALRARGWTWPLVAKPDVGQRGTAVRWIRSDDDLAAYLAGVTDDVLLQMPHAGPYEAGLYYLRPPGAPRGRLTSITDKRFPVVVGDGVATLATLIEGHPRYGLQADLLRARHVERLGWVPPAGQAVPLGRVGNHAQGTMFVDGARLWTPALEARIDAIAREVPGFHIGRFDVRYSDPGAFQAGDDLAIVELNGVSSEPTHIYEPGTSLVHAWRTLCAHWTTAFRFGKANRDLGHAPAPLGRIVALVWQHSRSTPSPVVSD